MRKTQTSLFGMRAYPNTHLAWWKLCILSGAAVVMAPLAVVLVATLVATAIVVFPALPWFLGPARVSRHEPPPLPPSVVRLRPVGPLAPARASPASSTTSGSLPHHG
jgi:hypothetical protein